MTSELNNEETMLVETVRTFIDRDVKPSVREVEHANEYPHAWIEQMKRIGIFGLAVPEEYGGSPVSMPCYVQVTQELARGWMSLAGAMGGHTVVAKLISLFGTEEQRRKYLPDMATGENRATMALTEPGGGSDLQAMTTTARADGDELVINGTKTWISNARRSNLIALLCKTDPQASPRHRGISVVLVEHRPGLTVSRDLPKLGYKGVESCELSFDDCRVPQSAILGGEPGKGFAQMMKGLETGRIKWHRAHSAWRPRHSKTLSNTRRNAKALVSRSGNTRRWATIWPTWQPNSPRPDSSLGMPRSATTAVNAAIWKPGWPNCSPQRLPCRSPWTRSASTAVTGIRPNTTSSATSATPH